MTRAIMIFGKQSSTSWWRMFETNAALIDTPDILNETLPIGGEIQAAIDVIGQRRQIASDGSVCLGERGDEFNTHMDFSRLALLGANFSCGLFKHANFQEANLRDANFANAEIDDATFTNADFNLCAFLG